MFFFCWLLFFFSFFSFLNPWRLCGINVGNHLAAALSLCNTDALPTENIYAVTSGFGKSNEKLFFHTQLTLSLNIPAENISDDSLTSHGGFSLCDNWRNCRKPVPTEGCVLLSILVLHATLCFRYF